MITRVNTVLIGATCPASYTNADALAVGNVALFDANKNIITTADAAAAAKEAYIGICKKKETITLPNGTTASKSMIEYSNKLDKSEYIKEMFNAYTAPVQAKIEIDFTNMAKAVIGHRYVLRIVYKDLYEAPGQFTHTYEVVADSETVSVLANALVAKINKHAGRRVSAAFASNKITLTALAKDDNEEVNSINEYSVVDMEATLYYTIPGALLSNQPEKVAGVTITKTACNPGKGYWKQVRDAEVRAMGYKGHVFTGAYPSVEQARMVEKDATYDSIIIEHDNKYLTPDNQYTKEAPLMETIFVKAGQIASSTFKAALDAFVASEAPATETEDE